MALWRDGGFADDQWTMLETHSAPTPERGAIVVSFARWQADKAALETRADPVGMAIAADAMRSPSSPKRRNGRWWR